MGASCSKPKLPSVSILMLGLDGAGKTTLLYQLRLGQVVTTIPTIGFNVETVRPMADFEMVIWDLGGQERFRPLWRHYVKDVHGVIYVVDSSNRERIEEAREALFNILLHLDLNGVPLLLLANKQDLPDALSESQISELMSLRNLTGRKCIVQSACATTGKGLHSGLLAFTAIVKQYSKK